jgi:hypothetical protein
MVAVWGHTFLMPICIPISTREEEIMLKTFAVALLVTAMSVGFAEAKGTKAPPKAPPAL